MGQFYRQQLDSIRTICYYASVMVKKSTDKPMTEKVFKAWTETVFNKEIDEIKNTMATKADLANIVREVLKTNEDVKNIQETMSTKEDSHLILKKLDEISLQNETSNRKSTVHDHRLNEVESKLTNHEKRLISLESK